MALPPPDPDAQQVAFSAARRAAFTLAREHGAKIITRHVFPGSRTTTQDVEPLAGLRAAHEVELGARLVTSVYIREARRAGHSWHEIGAAMDLVPGGDAGQAGDTIAEAAYTYAAGRPDTETAWRYDRSFGWTCGTCNGAISDRGLCDGPAEDERGHAAGCARLAAAVAAWDAQWEAAD